MNSGSTTDSPYIVIATSINFENMMDYAITNYAKEYSCYSDFGEDFYNNLGLWEEDYIRESWESFCANLDDRLNTKISDDLACEGAFFEDFDYTFMFVFKVKGKIDVLSKLVRNLCKFRDIDGEDFYLAEDDMECYFSPSYSGEDKKHIWDRLGVRGIEWPPKIMSDVK